MGIEIIFPLTDQTVKLQISNCEKSGLFNTQKNSKHDFFLLFFKGLVMIRKRAYFDNTPKV